VNATIVEGDVPTEVARLKEQPGQDLLIYGSGDLVDELTRHRLIDEYRLMLYPVVVGSGKGLFKRGPADHPAPARHHDDQHRRRHPHLHDGEQPGRVRRAWGHGCDNRRLKDPWIAASGAVRAGGNGAPAPGPAA
jgi:hypothetical protein